MPETSEIGFAQLGIASILKQNRLTVPPNQREYSWTTKEVRTLLQDFSKAIAESESAAYFLGTIVTIPKDGGILEVVDGQQRLATVAIILASIRNYLKHTEPIIAESIENECLTVIDRRGRARIPRLKLNLDDNEFFRAMLAAEDPPPKPTHHSHGLIKDAFDESQKHIHKIVSEFDIKDHGDVLNRWLTFMESRALRDMAARVALDVDAYWQWHYPDLYATVAPDFLVRLWRDVEAQMGTTLEHHAGGKS